MTTGRSAIAETRTARVQSVPARTGVRASAGQDCRELSTRPAGRRAGRNAVGSAAEWSFPRYHGNGGTTGLVPLGIGCFHEQAATRVCGCCDASGAPTDSRRRTAGSRESLHPTSLACSRVRQRPDKSEASRQHRRPRRSTLRKCAHRPSSLLTAGFRARHNTLGDERDGAAAVAQNASKRERIHIEG